MTKALGSPRPLPLFAYGTLLDPAFTANLLKRSVEATSGRLLDFELLRIESMPFATVFEAGGEVVDGRIYRGLIPEDWERLDAYEGVHEGLYARIEARVVAEGASTSEAAYVYVATAKTLRRYGAL